MGVSFKICRVGSRCCPKVPHLVEAVTADVVDHEGGEAAQEGNSGDREGMLLPLIEDAPEALLPYDWASMTLFSLEQEKASLVQANRYHA